MKRSVKRAALAVIAAAALQATACLAADRVVVSAAASLKVAFANLAQAYAQVRPDVKLAVNFASAAQLASQIEQGAPVDVFASADLVHVAKLADKGLIAESAVFARNRLVVIVARNAEAPIDGIGDLAAKGVRLITTAPDVPIREYTMRFLRKADAAQAFGADFTRRVMANVISEELDVRMVAVKISLGEGDAAVVYATDVSPDLRDKLRTIEIPDALNVTAEYAVGLVKTGAESAAARDFYRYLMSAEARAQLAKSGFLPP